jgi:hypothetical protein
LDRTCKVAEFWRAGYAQPHRAGEDRAREISTVVTFGNPEIGSQIADVVAGTIDASSLTAPSAAVLRTILAVCGNLSTASVTTGTVCDYMPAFAKGVRLPG